MWTRFMDMHSGGGQKLAWDKILIEAPKEEAKRIFYAKFGRNPERVTCTCCGDDYSISSEDSLEKLTAFDRGGNGAFSSTPKRTLKEYLALKTVKVIRAKQIKPEWRSTDVPPEGYQWVG